MSANQKHSYEANVVATKVMPITLYKVSTEWINNLMTRMKSEVIGKAIEHECPANFLKSINELELNINQQAEFNIIYRDSKTQTESKVDTIENPTAITERKIETNTANTQATTEAPSTENVAEEVKTEKTEPTVTTDEKSE